MKKEKKGLSLRKEPNQERSQETMENIVQATAHILEKEGFEKTSTNKIAARAGVSIGSLYQYFPTKESIIALMMDKYMKNEMDRMDKVLREQKADNLKDTIRAIVISVLDSKKKSKRFTKIFAQKMFGFNKVDALNKVDNYLIELFKSHIEPYKTEIRTENLELSLYMCIQCVKVIPVSLIFQENYDLEDSRVEDELVHLVYSYIRK